MRIEGRTRNILVGMATAVVLYTVVGFWVLPPLVKRIAVEKLTEALHRQAAIRAIEINPYTLSLTVKGFSLKERSGPGVFVSFDEIYVNLEALSVFRGGPVVREVRLERPVVNIVRNDDLSYNFSDLLPKPEKPSEPVRFSINNIQLLNGSIDFSDMPKRRKHQIRDIKITVPFVSNIPHYVDVFVRPSLSLRFNEAGIQLLGDVKPFSDSLETSIDVDVTDLDIPSYIAYIPLHMDYKVTSGRLTVKTKVSYIQYKDRTPSLTIKGAVRFKDVALQDGEGNPMLTLPAVDIDIHPSDVFARKLHLSKVAFTAPSVEVERDEMGKVNLASLAPESRRAEPQADKTEGDTPFSLVIDEVKLAQARVKIADLRPATPFRAVIDPLDLTVRNFSTLENAAASYMLSLRTDAGETVKINGTFSLHPLASDGMVEITSVPIKRYSSYYTESILFDVKDGSIQLATRYAYARNGGIHAVRFSDLSAILQKLRLRKRDESKDFVSIPFFSYKGASLDLAGKELTVGQISSRNGKLVVERLDASTSSLDTLFPAPAAKEAALAAPEEPPQKPWLVTLNDLALERYEIDLHDYVPSEPFHFAARNIKLRLKGLSTGESREAKISLSCALGKSGLLSSNGSLAVKPLGARLNVRVEDFDISVLQPYISDKVRIILTAGRFSTAGNFALNSPGEGGHASSYAGEAQVRGFASIDELNGDEFLSWKSLSFGGIDVRQNPTLVAIKAVSLTDFYSRVTVNPDGSLTPTEMIENEETPAEPPKTPVEPEGAAALAVKKEPKPAVRVDTITLQGGTINLTDRHIKPSYTADLVEISGRVSGLSSEETIFADVDLFGKLDNYAPMEITGKINPLRDDLFVDLKAAFKNMELSPLTPYAGKYVGYTVAKGKLSFNLQYQIVKRKLDSQNNVFFDQLTLGDKVDSPDATKLPVRFAIALLKDRKGQIDLNIPVSGTLDDPKFSVGRIVLKVIVNLLTKAATSPFALLGAIMGGGEELSYAEFDQGMHNLTGDNMAKLDKLIGALYDRPNVKLEIEGYVDTEKDKESLRDLFVKRKVKAQKLQDLVKKDLPALPVDEVTVAPEEYETYVTQAYKKEKFPKPKNVLGLAKDLPVPEMEKLMLAHTEITDGDLRQLASLRAKAAQDYVLASKKIEPDRIFLVEAQALSPKPKEKVKNSRVDFRLQ